MRAATLSASGESDLDPSFLSCEREEELTAEGGSYFPAGQNFGQWTESDRPSDRLTDLTILIVVASSMLRWLPSPDAFVPTDLTVSSSSNDRRVVSSHLFILLASAGPKLDCENLIDRCKLQSLQCKQIMKQQ